MATYEQILPAEGSAAADLMAKFNSTLLHRFMHLVDLGEEGGLGEDQAYFNGVIVFAAECLVTGAAQGPAVLELMSSIGFTDAWVTRMFEAAAENVADMARG